MGSRKTMFGPKKVQKDGQSRLNSSPRKVLLSCRMVSASQNGWDGVSLIMPGGLKLPEIKVEEIGKKRKKLLPLLTQMNGMMRKRMTKALMTWFHSIRGFPHPQLIFRLSVQNPSSFLLILLSEWKNHNSLK